MVCDDRNGGHFAAHLALDGDNANAVSSDVEKPFATIRAVDGSVEFIEGFFVGPQYDFGGPLAVCFMRADLGIAAILSDFAPGGNSFESYLFGSISSVTIADLRNVIIVFIPVLIVSLMYYGALLDIAIDSNLAKIAGVKVRFVNGVFTLLSAITIALACKIVGALLVASLIALPVATALIVSRSYKTTFIVSVILGIIYTMLGIVLSYYYDVRPGGAIVINAVIGMLIMSIYARIRKIHTKA